MMPLAAIEAIRDTVSDAWESPVADQVAAAWGLAPGTAKWWRSSASHVFVIPGEPRRYLRFVPDAYRGPEPVATVAELMRHLSETGSAVCRPVPTVAPALTVTVDTELGPMHAMMVEGAPRRGGARGGGQLVADSASDWAVSRASWGVAAPESAFWTAVHSASEITG
jgi:hypothetical protein